MKHWILAFMLASLCSQVSAAEYSVDFIAQHLAKRDQEKGLPNDQHRVDEIKYMLGETADKCQSNSGNEPAYMSVADKVMMSRNLLGEKGIEVSMYDLLDVLKSTLGEGGKGWDCAAVLSAYVTSRQSDRTITHLGAYKVVQSFRDTGILHAKQ